jgi:CMP-N,N'-diacetyllegionaminic acid synthase
MLNGKRILALIPARSGSKRVKDKNIREIGGMPLISWALALAMNVPEFDRVLLSTDSKDYARIANWAGVIFRPPELCSDTTGDAEVIKNAIGWCQDTLGQDFDWVVYIRPTTPFRRVETVRRALQELFDAGEAATGLRSVELMAESAFKCFTVRPGPFLVEIGAGQSDLPNQEVRKTYRGNGYVDIAKVSEIQAGRLWGDNVIAFVTPPSIEIDTEDDLLYAHWWYTRKFTQEEVIFK